MVRTPPHRHVELKRGYLSEDSYAALRHFVGASGPITAVEALPSQLILSVCDHVICH